MKKFLLLSILLVSVFSSTANAQQDPQFSLFMFNRLAFNPAYAGFRGATNFTASGRTQWVGIDGHPSSFTLTGDAPVNILHGGVGGTVIQDQIGPINSLYFKANYAYRFNLNPARTTALHIGIAPGFFSKSIDISRLLPETQNDPVIQSLIAKGGASTTQFDLGAGAYLGWGNANGRNGYIGIQTNHLTEPKMSNQNGLNKNVLHRAYSIMAGYRIPLAPVAGAPGITPSIMVYNTGSQTQLQANANLDIMPMVFGISYRGLKNLADLTGMVGFHANQSLFVAYAYDYTLSGLQSSTSGSHEILLSYTLARVLTFPKPVLDTMDSPEVR